MSITLTPAEHAEIERQMRAWTCEDCGWEWPSHLVQPNLDSECDNCGGIMMRTRGPVYLTVEGDQHWRCKELGHLLYDCHLVAPSRFVEATGPADHFDALHARHCTDADCLIDGIKRAELRVTEMRRKFNGGNPRDFPVDVLFAHATIEVLPVVDANDSYADHGLNHACLFDGITFIHHGKHYDELTLDPLPRPGRDWVVVLDNVEMT